MENALKEVGTSLTSLTSLTSISPNFLAAPEGEGFRFAANPLSKRGLTSLARTLRAVRCEHPCLVRGCGLWAADHTEAQAVLWTLERRLETL